jgi:hypothetical protein
MKLLNLFILLMVLFSFGACKNNKEESIQDLKGILENQKDKSTVQLKVEGSENTEISFLRNDALHPRILFIRTGDEMEVAQLQQFWKINNFSTSYYKDQGIFLARYRNSIDSAVLFSKYYLYDILKIDPKKGINFEVTDDSVVQ